MQITHRRSVSKSSTSSYAGPSRFRAEAQTQYAKARACAGTPPSLAHPSKILSEDHLVCESKLYDAFELQGLEQQLDRKLNFLNDHKSKLYDEFELQELEQQLDRKLNFFNDQKSRSFSSLISDHQESLNYKKSLICVSNLLNDGASPADHQLGELHAGSTCNFCNTDGSLNILIDDSALPKRKQSLRTACRQKPDAAAISLEHSDHLQAQAGCSCNKPRPNMNDPLHEEEKASYARRASSMPRFHYCDIEHAGDHSQAMPPKPAYLDCAAQEDLQEALQDLQDQRAVSITEKELKAHKQIRAKRSRWSLVNSLFRSLRAMHKKQDRMYIVEDAEASTSTTSLNFANQQQSNEYRHHHNIVQYHHVHHHHHHHVVNGIHFEEINWPLSPARLQELGWLMPKTPPRTEDFEQIDWPLSPARLQELGWLMPKSSPRMEAFEQIDWPLSPARLREPKSCAKMEDF